MIHCSRPARSVIDHLETAYGIRLELQDRFDLEVCCSRFLPSHIIGVTKQILRGKNVLNKLGRAQSRKWGYFDRPVYDFLENRASAHVSPPLDSRETTDYAPKAYRITCATFCVADFPVAELRALLYDIPPLLLDKHDLLNAIQAAKNQGVGDIRYVRGILAGRRRDERASLGDEADGAVWEPEHTDPVDIDAAIDHWHEQKEALDFERELRRIRET